VVGFPEVTALQAAEDSFELYPSATSFAAALLEAHELFFVHYNVGHPWAADLRFFERKLR
jgi:hypothetical protein